MKAFFARWNTMFLKRWVFRLPFAMGRSCRIAPLSHGALRFFCSGPAGAQVHRDDDKGDTAQTPATVAKHLAQVQIRAGAEVIFVSRASPRTTANA
jgi:hypothetical protein